MAIGALLIGAGLVAYSLFCTDQHRTPLCVGIGVIGSVIFLAGVLTI